MTTEVQFQRGYEPPSQPVWLVSFADLISLLLCFFVMIFAMSAIELARWKQIVNSVGTTNVVNPPTPEIKPVVVDSGPRRPGRVARGAVADNGADLDYLAAIIERRIAEDDDLDGAVLTRLGDSLAISMPAATFAAGRSEPNDGATPFFVGLGRVLGNMRNQVDVRGYGGWELAIRRAAAVASEMRRGGYLREPNVLAMAGATDRGRDVEVIVRAWRPEAPVRAR